MTRDQFKHQIPQYTHTVTLMNQCNFKTHIIITTVYAHSSGQGVNINAEIHDKPQHGVNPILDTRTIPPPPRRRHRLS